MLVGTAIVVLDWTNSCTSPSNITTQHESDSWFPTEQESLQSRWHVGGSRTLKCHTAVLNVLPRFSKRFAFRKSRPATFLQIGNISGFFVLIFWVIFLLLVLIRSWSVWMVCNFIYLIGQMTNEYSYSSPNDAIRFVIILERDRFFFASRSA